MGFHNRMNAHFTDVEYFADRYSTVLQLTAEQCNALFGEFVDYQLLESTDISDDTWKAANVQVEEGEMQAVRPDAIWNFLASMTSADGCRPRFPNLEKGSKTCSCSSHSNAGEERLFSLVRLNKTSYRSAVSLDGTLSSIVTVKTHLSNSSTKFDPPKELPGKAKKATKQYNLEHRN